MTAPLTAEARERLRQRLCGVPSAAAPGTPLVNEAKIAPLVQDFTDSEPTPTPASGDDPEPEALSPLARLEACRKRVGTAGRAEMPAARFAFVKAQSDYYQGLYEEAERELAEAKTPRTRSAAKLKRDGAYQRYSAARRYV